MERKPIFRKEWLPWALVLLLTAFLMGLMHGCATAPQGPTQTVYTAGWTLVAATNSVADLQQSGQLKGQDLATAKETLNQANTAYMSARAALSQGKPADAQTYLTLLQTLLNQLAAYLQAHGAK